MVGNAVGQVRMHVVDGRGRSKGAKPSTAAADGSQDRRVHIHERNATVATTLKPGNASHPAPYTAHQHPTPHTSTRTSTCVVFLCMTEILCFQMCNAFFAVQIHMKTQAAPRLHLHHTQHSVFVSIDSKCPWVHGNEGVC